MYSFTVRLLLFATTVFCNVLNNNTGTIKVVQFQLSVPLTQLPSQVLQQLHTFQVDTWSVHRDYSANLLRVIGAADTQTVHELPALWDGSAVQTFSSLSTANIDSSQASVNTPVHYHTLAETTAKLSKWEATYPHVAHVFTLGHSVELRSIQALKISLGGDIKQNNYTKPEVVYLGAHHAREWISTEVVLCLANYFLKGIEQGDPIIRNLLSNFEIWLVPVVNPDGFVYTHQSGVDPVSGVSKRFWRKNRRKFGNTVYGVDLNRNYNDDFGGPGASNTKSATDYHGPAPFSEPETRAIRDFTGYWKDNTTWVNSTKGLVNNVLGCISYHSYGELILFPPADTYSRGRNHEFQSNLALEMNNEMRRRTGNSYTVEQESALYLVSGDFCGWWYTKNRGKACMSIELRPGEASSQGFLLPADQIKPTCTESIPAAMFFALYLQENKNVKNWWTHRYHYKVPTAPTAPSPRPHPPGPPGSPADWHIDIDDNDTGLVVILCTVAACVMIVVVFMLAYSWKITRRRLTAQAMTGDVGAWGGGAGGPTGPVSNLPSM
eukprot:TRINITY_DN46455_c0_g1_i1.p1 TRINITY_DN46455_c0_g1~~TRINITY_DN46455_c0_g1_i1.p1  ORF type:complete len:550 (+),score=18.80 TRINITY_DN46455_c0_g1_i1:28-1677(+)